MIRWRRLRTLILREIRATFRDPFTVTILIAVPLFAQLLFGYVLSTEVKDLALGVHDAAQTSASSRLVSDLLATGTFKGHQYQSRDDLDEALIAGKISAGIVIPPDFGRDLTSGRQPAQLQLIYDGGEAVLAGNAEAFLRALTMASLSDVVRAPPAGALPQGAASPAPALGDPLDGSAPQTATPGQNGMTAVGPAVQLATQALFNATLDGKPFMVSGTFGFVLSFLTTLITAVSIVNERLSGTFEQLQVTPATSIEILLAKLLPLGAVFALDVGLMTLAAGFLLGVWPAGSLVFFITISSLYVLISLAIGLILSATSATAAEAVQKTVLLSVPLVQTSGFLFPLRNMPRGVAWAAQLFPATHYIRVSRAIYLRGASAMTLLPELLLLLFFGIVLTALALRAIESRQ
jgi:ABC-2 type transport system permease protein